MAVWNPSLSCYLHICRKIENITKKCVNLKGSLQFKQTCLNNGLYPEYTKIYLYVIYYVYIHSYMSYIYCT